MSSPRAHTSSVQPTQVAYTSFAASVRRIQRLSPNFTRVTLGGDELANFHAAGLDQRVKLILPIDGHGHSTFPRDGDDWYSAWRELPDDQRCPMRTYTVRASRPELAELDIDFVVHGDSGPATRWVNRATVGDELLLIGPDVRTLVQGDAPVGGVEFRPGNVRRILLAGDETAAPAICSIVESLPAGTRGQVFIEVATEADILPLATPGGLTVSWLPRDRRPGLEHGAALDRAVRAWVGEMVVSTEADGDAIPEVDVDTQILWEVPEDTTGETEPRELYAWIAGEAGCIKELRRYLVRDAGLDRHDVAFMGYWRMGKAEN